MAPLFSILIPSYNRPELIVEAVRSILQNDYEDLEIIISDDKSPRQEEIVTALKPFLDDSKVHLYLQQKNLREPGNRNFLFQKARGDWHIVLMDDDKLYPNALSTLAKAIADQPGADIYAFGYTIIDERNEKYYSRNAPKPLRVSLATPRLARELLVSDMFPFWMYQPATLCARRDIQSRIKCNLEVGIGDDIMFLIDFINDGGVLQIVPEVLMYYRLMTPQGTSLQMNQSAGELPNIFSRAKIMQHLLKRSDLHPVFANFVKSKACRQRLLYDAILWSDLPLDTVIAEIGLAPEHTLELLAHARNRPRVIYRKWQVLRRSWFFLSLFRFEGLREMWKVRLQRIKARSKKPVRLSCKPIL